MRILMISGTAIILATAGFAATVMDADGDGNVTMDELMAAYPEATVETFNAIDTDADGALSVAEIEAAQQSGLLPS